jgi:hypothetical protein
LRDGPYGRCIYACDNDVVDYQVVSIEYEGGVTASFTALVLHGVALVMSWHGKKKRERPPCPWKIVRRDGARLLLVAGSSSVPRFRA